MDSQTDSIQKTLSRSVVKPSSIKRPASQALFRYSNTSATDSFVIDLNSASLFIENNLKLQPVFFVNLLSIVMELANWLCKFLKIVFATKL